MNNPDNRSDIDYMIVTATGRLWTCRALVIGLVRQAGWRGIRLCPNYLVAETALCFSDRTLYTARELAQMIPLAGLDIYQRILDLNRWSDDFLPNARHTPPNQVYKPACTKTPHIKSILEAGFRTPLGAIFENWEMTRKIRKLSQEQDASPEVVFSAEICKGHFHRHGQHTRQRLQERLAKLLEEVAG